MKPSRTYAAGNRKILGQEVDAAVVFTRYAHQELGVPVPVGGSNRGLWFRRLKDEMDWNTWTWEDLVNAVRYVKNRNKRLHTMDGIFYFVGDAKRAGYGSEEIDDLQAKVAEALYQETDEAWIRRLSLAQGTALRLIYQQWQASHEV